MWIVLGDSAAQAVGGESYDGGYIGGVRQLLEHRDNEPWRLFNVSVSGAKAADVVAEQIPKLRQAIDVFGEPALITAIVVGNDATFSPLDQWIADTEEMLPLLPRGTVVASTAGGWSSGRTTKFNEMLIPSAEAHGLRVAPFDQHIGPPFRGCRTTASTPTNAATSNGPTPSPRRSASPHPCPAPRSSDQLPRRRADRHGSDRASPTLRKRRRGVLGVAVFGVAPSSAY